MSGTSGIDIDACRAILCVVIVGSVIVGVVIVCVVIIGVVIACLVLVALTRAVLFFQQSGSQNAFDIQHRQLAGTT